MDNGQLTTGSEDAHLRTVPALERELARVEAEMDDLRAKLKILTAIPPDVLEKLKTAVYVEESLKSLIEQEETPTEWLKKLKALRGKSCTYGGCIDFVECEHYRNHLAETKAIVEGVKS